jgi:hypothetical protein
MAVPLAFGQCVSERLSSRYARWARLNEAPWCGGYRKTNGVQLIVQPRIEYDAAG